LEIGEGITSTEGNEVTVNNVKNVNLKKEDLYDLILIGSPVHFGKQLGSVKKFINKLPKSQLKVKAYDVFNTYMGEPIEEGEEEGICSYQKMLNKMEKQIGEQMPDLIKASSGLSIKVEGNGPSKGPIVKEDLPKCKEFGIKLGE
jgi:menaquinone-dependent protoporphyrinogen IX oxidase